MSTQPQPNARILPHKLIAFTLNSLEGLAAILVTLKATPNALSAFALFLGAGAGFLYYLDHPVWAGVVIIFCGLFDILDGKVAVRSNKQSLFGAIFDSTLDRYSEFLIYLGLALHFRHSWVLWVPFFTFLGSSMVSYTRARAEGLGLECRVGVMQRAERMLLLALGSFFGAGFGAFDPVMTGVLLAIAVLSNFTAFQRTFYVRKAEKQKKGALKPHS